MVEVNTKESNKYHIGGSSVSCLRSHFGPHEDHFPMPQSSETPVHVSHDVHVLPKH